MKQHGEHSIEIDGHTVILTTASAFNGEGMERAYQNLVTLTKDLRQWILFIQGSQESGATPEAMTNGAQLATLLPDMGCIAIVSLNRTLLMKKLAYHVFDPSGLPLCITGSAREAKTFAHSILEEHGLL